MNHGPRFWKIVAKSVPRLHEAKTLAAPRRRRLHRYGDVP